MREVNFSIPNVNKASVGITTALYDRRALDCTSTLPLINSLNHLAYLTTSSARIRDILTIDGGVERLVCILKQGRSTDMMEMWKWNLAFQCVVNIGVRGSESVRTRVVEADMVPVIATILNNYIMAVDHCREKAEAENSGRRKTHSSSHACPNQHGSRQRKPSNKQPSQQRDHSISQHPTSRRQDPPPAIEIPQFTSRNEFGRDAVQAERESDSTAIDATSATPTSHDAAPMDQDSTPRIHSHQGQYPGNHHPPQHHHHHRHHQHHHHHRSQEVRGNVLSNATIGSRHISVQSLPQTVPSVDVGEGVVLRPVREVDRLPSTVPPLQAGIISQPDSPTTPSAPSIQSILESTTMRQQPSVSQQQSSGDSDDANADEAASESSINNENTVEPMIDIQTAMDFQGREDQDAILDDVSVAATLQTASEGREAETFNITHQSANDGSIINATVTPTANTLGLPPTLDLDPRPPPGVDLLSQPLQTTDDASQLLDRSAPAAVIAATPRDEDVLMSLQLLAYVSKYCNLRSYFQMSHLVPRLQVKEGLGHVGDRSPDLDCQENHENDEDEDEEFLRPDDFNIFPLVEKFTVRHHSQDMQHWAGVVMRNLCRKDDARGGIRQCAYYECGRWEQFTRQFAKCRRCRRTKYCSKECQKNAWVFHRHWCCQVAG